MLFCVWEIKIRLPCLIVTPVNYEYIRLPYQMTRKVIAHGLLDVRKLLIFKDL